jgi:hypothetical protein
MHENDMFFDLTEQETSKSVLEAGKTQHNTVSFDGSYVT